MKNLARAVFISGAVVSAILFGLSMHHQHDFSDSLIYAFQFYINVFFAIAFWGGKQ